MQFKRTIVAFSALAVMVGIIGYFSIGGAPTQQPETTHSMATIQKSQEAFKSIKSHMAVFTAMNMVGLNKEEIATADSFLQLMAKYEEIKEMREVFPKQTSHFWSNYIQTAHLVSGAPQSHMGRGSTHRYPSNGVSSDKSNVVLTQNAEELFAQSPKAYTFAALFQQEFASQMSTNKALTNEDKLFCKTMNQMLVEWKGIPGSDVFAFHDAIATKGATISIPMFSSTDSAGKTQLQIPAISQKDINTFT